MKRKKILLLITKSNWGGAQRYVYDLATNLDKNKFEVAVAIGGDGPLKIKLEAAKIRVIGLANLGRDVKIGADFKVFVDLIKLFRTERPDVVHLNSSKIGGLGAVAGRIARVPKIIFTFHGLAFNEDRSNISKIIIKFIYWITLLFCHQTIAVSNYVRNRLKNWALVQNKITVIYNGIAEIDFLEKEGARQNLLPLATADVWIGAVGELHHIKGHQYLIEALSYLSDVNFLCIIIGEGEEEENLRRLIEKYKLKDKIYLVGHRYSSPLLKAFDFFVMPSLSEGLAYAVLEAGAAALPVIASRVGGLPEIINNLENGLLVEPRRPDEIKNALTYLLNHKEEADKFGQNLQKKVLNDFSLQKMLTETERLYEN